MMTTKREVVEKMCGGKGHVIIDRILGGSAGFMQR